MGLFSSEARAVSFESGTLDEALERAKASGKLVLVSIGAAWCGPCHEMKAQVWPREDVSRVVAGGFVALERDGEVGEGEALVKRYHVVGYPTLLVLDAAGAELDRLMGFVPPKQLIASLRELKAGRGGLGELEKKLQANPKDEALALDVATRHALRGEARAVEELRALAAGNENQGHRASQALLVLGKYYYLRGLRDGKKAEELLRELVRRFPQTDEAQEAGYHLGLALFLQGKKLDGQKALDEWLKAAPRETARYNAVAWAAVRDGLDRAHGLEVARRGLELDPADHALWDTLAELESLSGHAAEAVKAEQKALELKPGDPHYQAQLRRFGGGT